MYFKDGELYVFYGLYDLVVFQDYVSRELLEGEMLEECEMFIVEVENCN